MNTARNRNGLTKAIDYFTWNRDFHGIRSRDTDDERPEKLNAAAHAVACAIAAHINGKTGEAKLGIRRIAESAQVSTSTALLAIEAIEAAGWLLVTRRTRPGTQANGTSIYMLASPVAGARAEAAEPSEDSAEVYRESLQGVAIPGTGCSGDRYETTSLTSLSTSRDKGATAVRPRPALMADDFTPNDTNRRIAAEDDAGIDLGALIEAMQEWSRDYNKKFTDWDRTIGAWLKAHKKDSHSGGRWVGLDYDGVIVRRAVAAGMKAAHAAAGAESDWQRPQKVTPEAINAEVVEESDAETVAVTPGPGREDTDRHWQQPTAALAVDIEANSAAISALAEVYDAADEAEIEAQRRGRITRKIAVALPRGIRQRERAEVERRIEAGENVDTIVRAIKTARSETKATAAADLAAARTGAPYKPDPARYPGSHPHSGLSTSARVGSVRVGPAEFVVVDTGRLQASSTG